MAKYEVVNEKVRINKAKERQYGKKTTSRLAQESNE
jgi:hypothetical protein